MVVMSSFEIGVASRSSGGPACALRHVRVPRRCVGLGFRRRPPGPTGIYRVGLIDVVGLAIMVAALTLATRAALSLEDGARRL
jgi:hypothetical protein